MNAKTKIALVVCGALALSACSSASSLLNGKGATPQAVNVPVGNALAMPPDLQLAAPGQTTDAYVPNGPVDVPAPAVAETKPTKLSKKAADAQVAALPALKPLKQPDIYEQYGVSKVNDDGTPRTPDQLREAVRQAILAKRKAANPNYGTIANIGNIFKDQ